MHRLGVGKGTSRANVGKSLLKRLWQNSNPFKLEKQIIVETQMFIPQVHLSPLLFLILLLQTWSFLFFIQNHLCHC